MDPEVNSDSHLIKLGLTMFKNYADPEFDPKEDEFKKKEELN